jgi:hypothetical protein
MPSHRRPDARRALRGALLLMLGGCLVGGALTGCASAAAEGDSTGASTRSTGGVAVAVQTWHGRAAGDVPVTVTAPAGVDGAAVLATAEAAAQRVHAVLPDGLATHPPVIDVVDGTAALARATGRTPAAVAGLAAFTTADRVYVEQSAYGGLDAEGKRVLLAHELTHLATGAAGNDRVPLWLEEGFADWVALSGSPLAVTAADPLVGPVRTSGPPQALPSDADFATAGQAQDEAYAGAWLAVRLIADRAGRAALLQVYAEVARGTSVNVALRTTTGSGLTDWTARWRSWLTAEAAR